MAKEENAKKNKQYGLIHALITGILCGLVALGIGLLIDEGTIKHEFSLLFPYAAVGVTISIMNFKPLSKLAIVLLPPVYAFSGFGLVAGVFVMSYFGLEKTQLGDNLSILVENVPFFIFATILYNWYSALAGEKSFIIYAIFATMAVVVSMLLFKDQYPIWMIQGSYLGISAFLFSLLHLKKPL